jgi:ubiquinone/menaquinone biosynthesis C-methylase UbiE
MKAGVSPKKYPQFPICSDAAAVLREHPAVRAAAACYFSADSDAVVAFVVTHDSYLDQVLGRKEAASNQVRKWRKTYDLSQLTKAAAASTFAFNIAGWNSSYTRKPIPQEDMREWVESTIERIAALAPTDVLEIGCGTGLLLLRLAAACKRYVGMDFAPSVLMRVREQLALREDMLKKVELLERPADNFDGFAENSFSTVILNSAAQYFPSREYLTGVLENAVRVVKPGGHIFIGDKRNFVLQRAQAASVEVFQAVPETSVAELRERIARRLRNEPELVPSPSYFLALQQRFPKVAHVEIHPRRGNCDNEMTRFRFDAILRIGQESSSPLEISFLDRPAQGWSAENIRSRLSEAKAGATGFAHVGNSRVEKDMRLLAQLADADPQQSLGELQKQIDQGEAAGVHPEEIFRLAAESGYKASISWAGCYSDGSYDAAFVRSGGSMDSAFPAIQWPKPNGAAYVYQSNAPGQNEIREKLVMELLAHCRAKWPDHSAAIVHLVDSLPRNENESVHFEALLRATQRGAAF